MSDQVIICPHCKKEIPLTEAISHQVRDQLQAEFELELKKQKAEIERIAKDQAQESIKLEMKDLQAQIEEKDKKLSDAQAAELEFRKKSRELNESQKTFELEMTRKLDQEREKIANDAAELVRNEQKLKEREKDKLIEDMKSQINDLKTKAEQGSQQIQGEVLELELEELLKSNFPYDVIEPVPKGIKGADIIQRIHNQSGQDCGSIIWETKRTKNWSESWIDKLKEDQRTAKAEISVLVSTVLPKEVNNFMNFNGVWVTKYSIILELTHILRFNLIQVANARRAMEGRSDKIEVLYNYLTGSDFKQHVESMVETFVSMKQDLDKEKRAITKIWAEREKQIERVVTNTAHLYGDMQGIIGGSLPEIKSLELKALPEGESQT
jgi:hypothetical protein